VEGPGRAKKGGEGRGRAGWFILDFIGFD